MNSTEEGYAYIKAYAVTAMRDGLMAKEAVRLAREAWNERQQNICAIERELEKC